MVASRKPYGEWLRNNLMRFKHLEASEISANSGELDILTLTQRQIAFGYSSEELDIILKPMFKDGAEGGRFDGRRHTVGCAIAEATAAIHLLQAALRHDQPAN